MLKDPMVVAGDLSSWLGRYATSAGRSAWVIGVSGGIDSAVSFRLAQMTGMDVFPVFLPRNRSQRVELMPLISDLLDSTGLEPTIHVIDDIVDLDEIPMFSPLESSRLAMGNYHARQRMALLYYYGEMHRGLVLGTTNAAEEHIGYFTKWGDGAVDVEPLVGLLKSEVRQVARALDVPSSIVEATPSANLWPGQTDEGELGFTYDQLDTILDGGHGVPDAVWKQILRMNIGAAHKKTQIPGGKIRASLVESPYEIGDTCRCGALVYSKAPCGDDVLKDSNGVLLRHCEKCGSCSRIRDLEG